MWRQNPKPKRLKLKNGEMLLACQHAFDSLFDQDFDEDDLPVMSLVAYRFSPDDGLTPAHRWYVTCNVCDSADTLEDLIETLYPTLGPLRITKRIRPLFDDWWLSKRPLVINVEDLLRTHAIGDAPKIGDVVHYCNVSKHSAIVYVLRFDATGADEIEAMYEGEELPAFTVVCPGCYVEGSPDNIGDGLETKIWTAKDRTRLNKQLTIHKNMQDFADYSDARDTPEDPDEDDLILMCPHNELEPTQLIYVETILDRTYDHPEMGNVVISWLALCEACLERHDGDIPSMCNYLETHGEPMFFDEDDEDEDDDLSY